MHYQNEVEIHVPREHVIQLFDNPDNMKHWQPGLLDYEPLDNKSGQVGAQTRLRFKMRNKEMEMTETVLKKELPELIETSYETKGVYNVVCNRFISLDDHKTQWISQNEFKFDSFMMKLFGALMPGMFKKQSQHYMDLFKEFAESRHQS
ncbi:MAG: SRPBCC family protein [Caldithrix sp.]|nr:SRPBCC family protein [Caldithrix sp.]